LITPRLGTQTPGATQPTRWADRNPYVAEGKRRQKEEKEIYSWLTDMGEEGSEPIKDMVDCLGIGQQVSSNRSGEAWTESLSATYLKTKPDQS
jgi:hypothetical protein